MASPAELEISVLGFWRVMAAGSVAGMVEHMAMFPVDTLKTRMQMLAASSPHHAVLGRFAASILRSEGASGLYRGIAAMGLGAGPAHAVHFAVYELAKHRLGANTADGRHHPLIHAASGILATTASDAVLTPMDVVKQRLQLRRSPYRGVRDCVARILTEEGIGAFYASYRTTILMNAPFTAVHFSTYEAVKKILNEVKPENASEERLMVHITAGGAAGALASALTTPLDVVKTRLQCQSKGFGSVMKLSLLVYSNRYVPFTRIWLCLLVILLRNCKGVASDSQYLIGLGSYDITGPAADVNMMGYANSEQIASGIHFRLQARSFIVADPGGNRVVFVNLDACMASQIVTIKVLERLKSRYNGIYNEKNVAISGIHTHSGPGGYLQYVVYIVTSLGFVRQSFDALVDGIEKSVIQAHENLRPGTIFVNKGEILYAGANRSPSGYLNNPAAERSKYTYNVDKDMTLLKFVDNEWGPVGSFNWFATHGTSMGRTNSLISGDNKGAAARFMEDWAKQKRFAGQTNNSNSSPDVSGTGSNQNGTPRRVSSIIPQPQENLDELDEHASSFPATGGRELSWSNVTQRLRSSSGQDGKPAFVSAFCQSNCGDVSPNVLGAFCTDTGLPCDFNHSTCNGKNELCYGRGPGYPDDFESTRIIADRQFIKAVDLFNTASEQVKGKVNFRHTYLDFSQLEVALTTSDGGKVVVKTCPAAMGFAFAAGTTDGPGAFDFKQGDNKGNAFWRLVGGLLKKPSLEQVDCQQPKPILLDTGEMTLPYAWAPSILPIQIFQIGQVAILCVPGEFTTMAGRRLRDAVEEVLTSGKNGERVHVVIAGLTNTYSQYITTIEEYEVQRYEGASTLFGPNTLSAYIQEFKKLATALMTGDSIPSGPQPPDLLDRQLSFLPGVVVDSTPFGVNFGDTNIDVPPKATFKPGDMVTATFWSACPRNDLLTEGTFALVEMLDKSRTWVPVYDDDDFCLRFKWSRPTKLSAESHATIEWRIPETAASGVYRLRHFGASKSLLGIVSPFTGASSSFVVL